MQINKIQEFIDESNQEIVDIQAEIKTLEGLMKYGQMTMEDFAYAHPDLALDPLNNPKIFPYTPEFQPDEEEEEQKAAH